MDDQNKMDYQQKWIIQKNLFNQKPVFQMSNWIINKNIWNHTPSHYWN